MSDIAELWRLTLLHSPIGLAVVALDGRIRVVNRALCTMLGFPAEDLRGRRFQEFTHADDLESGNELFGRAVAGEFDSFQLSKRYHDAQGRLVWADLSVALARGDDLRPLYFITQFVDMTEHREHEQRLAAVHAEAELERQTLEAIFETVNVGLLLIDSEGRYQRMNRRHQETMRLPFPDGHAGAAGQLGHVYFPDGKTLMAKEDMPSYRAAQGEEFDDYTYWVGDDPLTRSAFSTSARQVRGPAGERRGATLAYQEITDLMRALQVRDEFVASVSHELRTPLTSVIGHLEMLCEQEDLPPDVLGRLRVVQRNATRLRTLVSDLLHVAQAGEGALLLQRAAVDLTALVHDAVEAARPFAASSAVDVRVEAPERLVCLVDAHRLRQVLDNLVSNAVKYSEAGGTVTVVLREDDDTIVFEVSDTGIGIAAEEVEHVFDRFFRGGGALTRHIAGTGLGLNIVSSIVAAHHGTVSLESELGRGSTFRVRLPAPPV